MNIESSIRTGRVAAIALFGALTLRSEACDIPLFRFALERWEPHPYELVVFYKDRIPEPLSQALWDLEIKPVNLRVRPVDVASENMFDDVREIWEAEKDKPATLPWGVLRYPYLFSNMVKTHTLWSGRLDDRTLWSIVDSPARQKVAEHILKGMSAVWVFVEGSDSALNEAKYKELRQRLDWIEKEITFPEDVIREVEEKLGGLDPTAPGFVPLKIAFEILRVRRDDPAEEFFLAMLLRSGKDRDVSGSHPIAFPILGQGRLFWPLAGDDIKEAMIDAASSFALSPPPPSMAHLHLDDNIDLDLDHGVDMLVHAHWFAGVSNILSVTSEAPPLIGMGEAPPDDVSGDAPHEAPTKEPEPAISGIGRMVAGLLGVLLVVVAFVSVGLLKGRKE